MTRCICRELGATGLGQRHTRCPAHWTIDIPALCEQCGERPPTTRLTPGFAPQYPWWGCDECAAKTTRCTKRAMTLDERTEYTLMLGHCRFCPAPSVKLAPQSINLGHTIQWVPACESHLDGWWDGADWGPIDFRPLEDAKGVRA